MAPLLSISNPGVVFEHDRDRIYKISLSIYARAGHYYFIAKIGLASRIFFSALLRAFQWVFR